MPLHLLPKKSWNPYATTAIEQVKADEAAAADLEQRVDELRDEYDAQVRLAHMRGKSPPPESEELLRLESEQRDFRGTKRAGDGSRQLSDRKKRRRLPGEDDTTRDLRLAKEEKQDAEAAGRSEQSKIKHSDEPIVDRDGHIQLFLPADAPKSSKPEKNPEAEAERKRKERELEDQYTMRFSNAAGFKENPKDLPWYLTDAAKQSKGVGRNAFGREDEGRHARDAARTGAADPMAAMRAAQAKLKTVRQDRERSQRNRDAELYALKDEQRREERLEDRHHRKHHHRDGGKSRTTHDDPDTLEGFSLDAEPRDKVKHHHSSHRSSRERHERHRSRPSSDGPRERHQRDSRSR